MDRIKRLSQFRWKIRPKAFLPQVRVAEWIKRLLQLQWNIRAWLPKHLLFLSLVALRFYALLQHEVWRAEAQIPLLVRDTQSFGQMFYWQSYEKEHVLWPSLLSGLKMLGLDPVAGGQWLHLGFSILLLGIIFYGIPRLPLIIRVLAGSSYFLMYEYTAFMRIYGASSLLLGIFIMLELRTKRHILWKALTLFFLALSSHVGLALAIALAAYLFIKSTQERLRTWAIGAGIAALGIALSIATALPQPELWEEAWIMGYRASAFDHWGIPRLLETSSHIFVDGFLYIPLVTSQQWYSPAFGLREQSLLSCVLLGHEAITYLIGLMVIALALWVLWRLFRISKPIALAMAILWGGNLLVWSTMHPGWPRLFGILVLGTLGLFALAISRRTTFSVKWMTIFASVILVIQSISGFWAVYAEGRDAFSQSKNLAQWWQANYPQETPYVYPDHAGATLCVYKGGYTYSLASGTGEESTFVRQRKEFLGAFSVDMLSKLDLKGGNRLLVTIFPFHAILDGGETVVEPLQSFQPAVVPGESFWVHQIRPGSEKGIWTLKFLPFEGQFWTVETSQDKQTYSFPLPDKRLDNTMGSTAEIRVKFLKTPKAALSGANFLLLDGSREGNIAFFKDHIMILDQQAFKAVHFMNTDDAFHTYRISLVKDTMEVYVDGSKVASVTVSGEASGKTIRFEGFSTKKDEDMAAQIEYIAYSTDGALPPTAETEMWTQFTDMRILPDIHPLTIWAKAGTFIAKSIVDGVLTIGTRGADFGNFSQLVPKLNNAVGSTAEVRLRLLEGPRNDTNGAMFSLADGRREGKVSFFPDCINILDQNEVKAFRWMDTTDDFHTYRLAMVGDTLRVYLDGAEVAAITLSNQVEAKQILFGDFSTEEGENMSAKVDHLAHSVRGAMTPEGVAVEPIEKKEEETGEWTEVRWGLTVKTMGTETESCRTGYPIERFDNATGSTAEVRMRILKAPTSGFNGAVFSLADGTREGKLCFFSDRIEIRDQNDLKATHKMATKDDFHSYRMAIIEDTLKVYVDEEEVASVTLCNQVTDKKILFGDFSPEEGENINARVEYLAYSVKGAMTPEGNAMPPAPVVDVTPDSPKTSEDLVCRIVAESIDPDGDAINYRYAWYKDGVLQPGLTANTVNSSNTEWGEAWKCVVTPNDGILDGLSSEDQVTIDIGIWTKFSGMQVLPEAEPISPWGVGGTFETKIASGGILTFQTSGTHVGNFDHPEEGFDNAIGSVAEVKMRIFEAPTSGYNGAMLSLIEGKREGKLCFFNDRIEIRDQNDLKATYKMDTKDDFHSYRMAIIEDTLKVYVDGEEVASVTLSNQPEGKKILFGDFSPEVGENINAQVEYLAYSVDGAIAPQQ